MSELAGPLNSTSLCFCRETSSTASATAEEPPSVTMSTPSLSYQLRTILTATSGLFSWSAVTISTGLPRTGPKSSAAMRAATPVPLPVISAYSEFISLSTPILTCADAGAAADANRAARSSNVLRRMCPSLGGSRRERTAGPVRTAFLCACYCCWEASKPPLAFNTVGAAAARKTAEAFGVRQPSLSRRRQYFPRRGIASTTVSPWRKARTHNSRMQWSRRLQPRRLRLCALDGFRGMGPGFRQDDSGAVEIRPYSSHLLDPRLRRDQFVAVSGADRRLHPFTAAAAIDGYRNAVSAPGIGLHRIGIQDRLAALQRDVQGRRRLQADELEICAPTFGCEIDQHMLVRIRHIAHADGWTIGFRDRHFAERGKAGLVKEPVGHAGPQLDIRLRLVRLLARDGIVRERRKSPGPHLQAARDRVVGDADDALFIVVVDHAPEIAALHVRRRIGDAHGRPVLEIAQLFKTAPAGTHALIALGQVFRPARRRVGRDRPDDLGAASSLGMIGVRAWRERRAGPVFVIDRRVLRILQHDARVERGAIGLQRDIIGRLDPRRASLELLRCGGKSEVVLERHRHRHFLVTLFDDLEVP